MKYAGVYELPDDIRAVLPGDAQEIFLKSFNIACDQGLPTPRCFSYAWTMIRIHGYRKDKTGRWRQVQQIGI